MTWLASWPIDYHERPTFRAFDTEAQAEAFAADLAARAGRPLTVVVYEVDDERIEGAA